MILYLRGQISLAAPGTYTNPFCADRFCKLALVKSVKMFLIINHVVRITSIVSLPGILFNSTNTGYFIEKFIQIIKVFITDSLLLFYTQYLPKQNTCLNLGQAEIKSRVLFFISAPLRKILGGRPVYLWTRPPAEN